MQSYPKEKEHAASKQQNACANYGNSAGLQISTTIILDPKITSPQGI